MPQSGDPSVEDILQAIKEVMTREDPAGTSGDSVLELTEVVEHDGLDWPDAEADAGSGPGAHRPAAPSATSDDDRPLLATERQAAMRDSLSALAALAQPGTAARITRSAEASLDDLTRELLRPMLAAWLDTNLPPLVERLVKAEIARIAGQRD